MISYTAMVRLYHTDLTHLSTVEMKVLNKTVKSLIYEKNRMPIAFNQERYHLFEMSMEFGMRIFTILSQRSTIPMQ